MREVEGWMLGSVLKNTPVLMVMYDQTTVFSRKLNHRRSIKRHEERHQFVITKALDKHCLTLLCRDENHLFLTPHMGDCNSSSPTLLHTFYKWPADFQLHILQYHWAPLRQLRCALLELSTMHNSIAAEQPISCKFNGGKTQ